ncbi:hypothetical protein CO172_01165 [Candidatus Uhrbacteria bacterium CG_4_9_14_3_um_filter_36_7]|uniref:Glycosyltransferase family 1 protein n=1 Tax=Candidatus Uhrbacteria bacterium CG_4_9_14_3_um_filter_36_7 TaxID=1975033 RepID=A0A2M7XI04_9BACT|nr:MAG: hypothetical protein CO172_01165 [Candidatus Uhrbacteria bacterium CG_4_9_14_3_um_filter_36_7]
MQIAIDLRGLTHKHQSGVGVYTTELLNALFSLENNHTYLLFSSGLHKPSLNLPLSSLSHQWIHIPVPNKLLNLSFILTHRPFLNRFIKNSIQYPSLFFFPNINIISLRPQTPYVLTMHDLSFELFPEFFRVKNQFWHHFCSVKKLATKARAIIVPSKSTAIDLQNFYHLPPERIYIVPHGLSCEFETKTTDLDKIVQKKYNLPLRFVFFMGDIVRRKNISALIWAVRQYRKQTNEALEIVLVGKPGTALPAISQAPFIHYFHYIPFEERASFYRLALVTLFPSFYEGFGMPLLESMASGTPVITSRVSSNPEIAGEAAIFIDPYDPHQLLLALKQLVLSPLYYKDLQKRGFEQTNKFTWQKTAEQTIQVFEQTI